MNLATKTELTKSKRKLPKYFLVIFLCTIAFLFSSATPASAHAALVSTSPANQSILEVSPATIDITFTEGARLSQGLVELYNDKGERIVTPVNDQAASNVISITPPKLKKGTYLVTWSVVSGDSHPINGTFSFTINAHAEKDFTSKPEIAKIINETKTFKELKIIASISRFFVFAFIFLLIALIVVKIYLVQEPLKRNIQKIFKASLLLLSLFSLLSIGIQSLIVYKYPLSKISEYSVWQAELETRFGKVNLIRIFLCLCIYVTWKYCKRALQKFILLLLGISLAITPALIGHASDGKVIPIAFTFDVLHVLAGSVWLGCLLLLPFLIKNNTEQVSILKKFSKLAPICATTILVTGAFAWWRQIGSYSVSTSTWFGQLINAKVMIFLGVICIAIYTRRRALNIVDADNLKNSKSTKIVSLLIVESVLLLIALVLSTVAVNAIPGRTAYSAPVVQKLSAQSLNIEISVEPPKAGPIIVHVYVYEKNGTPKAIQDTNLQKSSITAIWTNDDCKSKSIKMLMRFEGLNHFSGYGTLIPAPGKWKLSLDIKVSKSQSIKGDSTFTFR